MNFKEFYTRTLPQEITVEEEGFKIYCDMDGVLCDFEKGIYEFYKELEWHPEGKKIWNFIKNKKPIILSSLGRENPDREGAKKGKQEWLKAHGINIPSIFTDKASDKQKHANEKAILIDDYFRNIDDWIKEGGKAIHFKTADEAIKQLKEFGIKENIVVAPYVIVPDKSTKINSEDK